MGILSLVKAYPLSIVAPNVAWIIGRQRSSDQRAKSSNLSSKPPVARMEVILGEEDNRVEGIHAKEELARGADTFEGSNSNIIEATTKAYDV